MRYVSLQVVLISSVVSILGMAAVLSGDAGVEWTGDGSDLHHSEQLSSAQGLNQPVS